MNGTTHLKIGDINKNLICVLCGGYYIDATTVIECLHSFCRTCIVTYLKTSKTCPVCDTVVHKTRPHQHIRSDKLLQDLVYKLVPGLYRDEMRRRREFFTRHYEAAPKRPGEERGDEMSDRFAYTEEEKISLALHFCREGASERVDFRRVFTSREDLKARVEKRIKEAVDVRYLQCKAAVTIGHLKKFVRLKYGLPSHFQVEMFYNDEPLRNSCTLCDITYFFSWRRRAPLVLTFCVYESPRKYLLGKDSLTMTSITPVKSQSQTITVPPSNQASDVIMSPEKPLLSPFSMASHATPLPESSTINSISGNVSNLPLQPGKPKWPKSRNTKSSKPKSTSEFSMSSLETAGPSRQPIKTKSANLGKRPATAPVRIAPAPAKILTTSSSAMDVTKFIKLDSKTQIKNQKSFRSPKLVSLLPGGITQSRMSPVGITKSTMSPVGITQSTMSPVGISQSTMSPVGISQSTMSPMGISQATMSPVGITKSTMSPVGITQSTKSEVPACTGPESTPNRITFSMSSILKSVTSNSGIACSSENNKRDLLSVSNSSASSPMSVTLVAPTFPFYLSSPSPVTSSCQAVSMKSDSLTSIKTSHLTHNQSSKQLFTSSSSTLSSSSSVTVTDTQSSHNSIGSPTPASSASPTPAAVPVQQSQTQGSDMLLTHSNLVTKQTVVVNQPIPGPPSLTISSSQRDSGHVPACPKEISESPKDNSYNTHTSSIPRTTSKASNIDQGVSSLNSRYKSETSYNAVSSSCTISSTNSSISDSFPSGALGDLHLSSTANSPESSPTSNGPSVSCSMRKQSKQKKIADIANTLHKRVSDALLQMNSKRSSSPNNRRSPLSTSPGKKTSNIQLAAYERETPVAQQSRQSLQNIHLSRHLLNTTTSLTSAHNNQAEEPLNLVKSDNTHRHTNGKLILEVPQSLK